MIEEKCEARRNYLDSKVRSEKKMKKIFGWGIAKRDKKLKKIFGWESQSEKKIEENIWLGNCEARKN